MGGRRAFDPVVLTGAVTALVGCVGLSLAVVRPSRVALSGEGHRALQAAGPWGIALVALAVAAVAVAFVPRAPLRSLLARLTAAALAVTLAFALGAAVTRLGATALPIARISPGAGFWVALAGCATLAFAGGAAGRGDHVLSLALTAAVALGFAAAVRFGGLAEVSVAREYAVRADVFWHLATRHLVLAGGGLLGGLVVGVPLGIAAARLPRLRTAALGVTGILETVPSLALLGLLIAPLSALAAASPALARAGVAGIGAAPALVALTLYALLPIVRGTYVALAAVDPALTDAARGMGMSRVQRFRRVEFPLALPLVLEGVRVAAVLLIGITTVTAFVGEGGFGALIFQGVSQNAADMILLGALPTIALAVAADYGLRALASVATPRGVRA